MKQILILTIILVTYQICMSQEMNELLLNKVTYRFGDYSTGSLVWRDVISPDSQSVSIDGIGPIDWSWNDTYILCVASLNNQGNIYITNVTSLASFPIPNISEAFEFDLARNESSLLYSKRLNIPPYSQIWKINIDGGGNQLLSEGRESKWSPDGTYIIYTTDVTERNNQIRIMNSDGSNNMVLVQAPPGDSIVFTKPLFSPDGSKIAFVESPNPNVWPPDTAYVVIADANGTNQTRIFALPKGDRAPAAINWSPTGDKLSIWEGEPVVEWNLWVVNSNGSNPLMIVQNANDWEYSFSSWAPDGNRLVFTAQSSIDIINDGGTNRQTVATLAGGQRYTHISWSKNSGVSSISEIKNLTNFYLYPNYPNPFNPITKIKFSIPNSDIVQIKIYDILGKELKTLVNEYKQSGTYEVEFVASNLTSGIYFYRMISGSYSETKKMLLLR